MSATDSYRGADPTYRSTAAMRAQEADGSQNLINEFLIPLFKQVGIPQGARVLDVGCGIGETVRALRQRGYEAFGLEPGGRFHDVANELRDYVLQEYSNEYSPPAKFDFVMTHGVIEHVGTTDGHDNLKPDFLQQRKAFIASLKRLTKPGGYVLICCPNRLFPFDFQHGPHSYGYLPAIKRMIPKLSNLTLPWHPKNYLCSFSDIARLVGETGAGPMQVRQGQYLNLGSLNRRPAARKLFRFYIKAVDAMPRPFWDVLHTHTILMQRIDDGRASPPGS